MMQKSPLNCFILHDTAMYDAKQNGRNCFRFFTQEIADAIKQRQKIENGLRASLENDQLSLVFMPIFDCDNDDIVAVEALLRCNAPELEKIGPDQFIPVAESTGLIKDIDLWVIEAALQRLVTLQQQHNFTGKMCINISGVELNNEHFPSQVKHLLEIYAVAPCSVELEVTETALVAGNKACLDTLHALREVGVSLALDDFGTGYTAFSQLIHYPAHCLKIDRSFISDLFSGNDPRSKMVLIIQNLAELYGLRVIAEGVETEEQLNYLKRHGCDWAQGYFLSRPLAWDDLLKRLAM